jgi:hypothetical protein
MKTYGEMELSLHVFLKSGLDASEWWVENSSDYELLAATEYGSMWLPEPVWTHWLRKGSVDHTESQTPVIQAVT